MVLVADQLASTIYVISITYILVTNSLYNVAHEFRFSAEVTFISKIFYCLKIY